MINFTAYQEWVRTKVRTPVVCSALGLAGEAGEVVDLLKKVWYHGKLLDREALKLELGDCLFYLTDLADTHGINLEDVAQGNVDKINTRYPNAFNVQDAQKAEAAKTEPLKPAQNACEWKRTALRLAAENLAIDARGFAPLKPAQQLEVLTRVFALPPHPAIATFQRESEAETDLLRSTVRLPDFED